MQNGHEDVVTSEGGVATAEAAVAGGGQRFILWKNLDPKALDIRLKNKPGEIGIRVVSEAEIDSASVTIGKFDAI